MKTLNNSRHIRKPNKSAGFTLIEVLVALVLVGVALPAMIIRIQSILDNTAYMEEKTYAYWIAENVMQEMILTQELEKDVTKSRKQTDIIEYADRKWHWKVETEETAQPGMYRIDVSVGFDEDSSLAALSGFILDPDFKIVIQNKLEDG
ncbi:MAG: type II secretion system protein GspI [Alteromonadaceae bacterium]|nr:MAG: type II secretion system protein GspI [Alteromonadaceae bacterium]